MTDILAIQGNRESFAELMRHKASLVPFVGAGFSRPACPTWADFLEFFFKDLQDRRLLLAGDAEEYLRLKESCFENRFEKMAGFLALKAERLEFEKAIERHFKKTLPSGMKRKFELFHRAFPKLKITTNYDCLTENSSPEHVETCTGRLLAELDRQFDLLTHNCLLKIHGGVGDIHSIVLSSDQYAELYGDPVKFNPGAAFPGFLKRVFTNASVLFIGCSLESDRTLMMLESEDDIRSHFAVMRLPGEEEKEVLLRRRLSHLRITPLFIKEFQQLEAILSELVGCTLPIEIPSDIDREVKQAGPVMFVGRGKQLEEIEQSIQTGAGSVQMITGRLFSIEGAGGVGKTTLAIEASRRFKDYFKDGILPPFRLPELSPMAFAMELANCLQMKIKEPPDKETARKFVTTLLKDRHMLIILDNAVNWKVLVCMLPEKTASTILVTTRNKELVHRLRHHVQEMKVKEISLEWFTDEEALDLFRRMLGKEFRKDDTSLYLAIAKNLGYLPIALRQAISLMLYGPHYCAEVLLKKLENEDRLELLRKGAAVEDSDCQVIDSVFDLSSELLTPELTETLKYMAICSPGPAPLSFLEQLSKDKSIGEKLERLVAYSWIDRHEREKEKTYEIHQLVRELAQRKLGNRFRDLIIGTVHGIFLDEKIHFSVKDRLYPQLEEVFKLAVKGKDKRLIDWMFDLYNFCTYRGYGDFVSAQISTSFQEPGNLSEYSNILKIKNKGVF